MLVSIGLNRSGLIHSRFIPALAGNIPRILFRPARFAVHPRARGEHLHEGSRTAVQDRFIPALAGNIRCQPHPQGQPPVHPRARGEHLGHAFHTPHLSGSSPRSRGTFCIPLNDQLVHFGSIRFIPALAGNIPSCGLAGRHGGSSPRSRGTSEAWAVPSSYGSSPRSRGTCFVMLDVQRSHSLGHRFIPALAGNIECYQPFVIATTVHPRARVEHTVSLVGASVHPRARGEHFAYRRMIHL